MDTPLMIMGGEYSADAHVPASVCSPDDTRVSTPQEMGFGVSDYLELNDWIEKYSSIPADYSQSYANTTDEIIVDSSANSSFRAETISKDSSGRETKEIKGKIAFRTKSVIEVLDDGFKWRKYGKKMVKNSPNPRNYYRCSIEGCPVKKRVERDNEDPLYVVTTYEGIHNHAAAALL